MFEILIEFRVSRHAADDYVRVLYRLYCRFVFGVAYYVSTASCHDAFNANTPRYGVPISPQRCVAIVCFLILGVILTSPDVVTQVLVALPLILLYDVGVFLLLWSKREKTIGGC